MQDEHAEDLGAEVAAALAEVRRDPDPGFERRMAGGARERALGRRARLTAAMAVVSAAAAAVLIWVLEHPAARLRGLDPAPRTAALPGCCRTAAAASDGAEVSAAELRALIDEDAALSVSADWEGATRSLDPYTRLLGGDR